tara:strand:- start:124 stop:366 length:243 start_codon:yes stop_codon:yes gene_type:complete
MEATLSVIIGFACSAAMLYAGYQVGFRDALRIVHQQVSEGLAEACVTCHGSGLLLMQKDVGQYRYGTTVPCPDCQAKRVA